MIVNDERLEVVRFNVLNGTMEVTAESLKANLQSYVNMKTERDTLIDDLKVLREKNEKLRKLKDIKEKALKGATYIIENQKATIKRLGQENAQLHKELKSKNKIISKRLVESETLSENAQLKQENKALRIQSDTYFNEWQEAKNEVIELKEQLMIVKNDNALLKSILSD